MGYLRFLFTDLLLAELVDGLLGELSGAVDGLEVAAVLEGASEVRDAGAGGNRVGKRDARAVAGEVLSEQDVVTLAGKADGGANVSDEALAEGEDLILAVVGASQILAVGLGDGAVDAGGGRLLLGAHDGGRGVLVQQALVGALGNTDVTALSPRSSP